MCLIQLLRTSNLGQFVHFIALKWAWAGQEGLLIVGAEYTISNHGKGKRKWPRAEKGMSKSEALLILKRTGMLVQVGSGIFE